MSGNKSGFVPNSFQTPNGYVDDLMPYLTGEEYKVLIYATRRILGFQKRQDRISLSQFTDGTKSIKDGRTLDSGTGLGRETVSKCLDTLVRFGLMVKEADNDPKTNEGTLWSLQWDDSLVNWGSIREAVERRSKINKNRMIKARSVGLTPVGGTDLPPASGTDSPPVGGTGVQNTGLEIQLKTEEEELKKLFLKVSDLVFPEVKEIEILRTVKAELELAHFSACDHSLIVSGLPGDRPEYYEDRYRLLFERAFIGVLGEEVSVEFFTGSGDVSEN